MFAHVIKKGFPRKPFRKMQNITGMDVMRRDRIFESGRNSTVYDEDDSDPTRLVDRC